MSPLSQCTAAKVLHCTSACNLHLCRLPNSNILFNFFSSSMQGIAKDSGERGQPPLACHGLCKSTPVLVILTDCCELVSMETSLLWPTFRQFFQFLF